VRLLLIGGSGFIGSFVARQLVRLGHDVTVFHRGTTRPGVAQAFRPANAGLKPRATQELLGDRNRLLESAAQFRALAPDVVVDLILSSARQARELMAVFRGAAPRVVALSSCDVYRACGVLHGSEPGPLEPMPLTEESAVRTVQQTYPPDRIRMLQQVFGWLDDEYDKIPVEREILRDREIAGTVLRLPMVYGPGDPLHRLFPIMKRMDDRRPAILLGMKQAAWRGPRGYVENVAAAIVSAATSDRAAGRVFNVAERDSLSELEWATAIAGVTGWPGKFIVLPDDRMPAHLRAPGNLDQHWVVDTTRIRAELDYAEPIARRDAISRTVDWEHANPPPIDPAAFDYTAEDAAIAAGPAFL
jgi:nucleoside-diphosphate-sugar epimerase